MQQYSLKGVRSSSRSVISNQKFSLDFGFIFLRVVVSSRQTRESNLSTNEEIILLCFRRKTTGETSDASAVTGKSQHKREKMKQGNTDISKSVDNAFRYVFRAENTILLDVIGGQGRNTATDTILKQVFDLRSTNATL